MKSEFWAKIDAEEKKETEQEEENWKFKIQTFKDLNGHPGWLLYLQDLDEWLESLNVHIEAMGFSEEPSMWKMGYHQGIRAALMRVKGHITRTIEEETE